MIKAIVSCLPTLAPDGGTALNWLLELSGLAALFTWGSIYASHIRFCSAWKYHGHTTDEIPIKAVFGVWGSWVDLIMIYLVLVAQMHKLPFLSSISS